MVIYVGMRTLQIADAETAIPELQHQIHRSRGARYENRLHGVLLVAQGMTCPQVSRLLGDSATSVEHWVRHYAAAGLAGLGEGQRSGRPKRLTGEQLQEINRALGQSPRDLGLDGARWDGKTLSTWLEERFHIRLAVRQCQRLLRQRPSARL